MEHRKQARPPKKSDQKLNYERSFIPGQVEYRAAEDGEGMGEVFGYALKWGVEYDMGWYREKIDRNALSNADMSDVRILDNHESHLVLGRTKSGTASVGTDEVGMWYRASLPDSPNGQNMKESLKRGDIDASSWGFRIRTDETGRRIGDKWEKRDGIEIRTITDISVVFDASPVTFPANPDTSAAKRSRDMAFSEKRDGGEDMGEGAPMGESGAMLEAGPADTWEIGWMMDSVAWATVTGNSTVRALNNCIDNYGYYAKMENTEASIFQTLVDSCAAAKAATVAMIDAHIDALKALNAAENRGKSEEKEETNTQYIAELEQFERRRMQLLFKN